MCWAEKCCFCIKLDFGCLLIGSGTLIVSLVLAICSIDILSAEGDADYLQVHHTMHQLLGYLQLEVKHVSKEVIFGIILFVSVLWIVSSMILIVGVKLNRSGFVLIYFAFGVFITFFSLLSSLLLLLQNAWAFAFVIAGAFLVHIHFLVVVHTFYELLVRGKRFGGSDVPDDQTAILSSP